MNIVKNCQICNGKLNTSFNLGMQPLCDDLIKINSRKKNKLYPTNILFCKSCITAYNEVQVIPKTLFPKSYHYRSNLTDDVVNGMIDLRNKIEEEFGELKKKVVLDVGCNDGSLLNLFKNKKSITIGVEPTDACKNIKNKHYIFNNFFNKRIAKKILRKFLHVDFIIFTNVFAHINNLDELISSLKILITRDTKIIIENHYLGSVLKKNQFDTFYHEHPRTYSFRSFRKIAKLLNMKIYDVEFPKRYGGNIRVIFSKKKTKKNISIKVKKITKDEIFYKNNMKNMGNFIENWKSKTLLKIKKLKRLNKKIVGKAFPGRASIIINLLKLDSSIINEIYEKKKSPKIGFYVPNTDIPIKSDKYLNNLNGNEIIINFAWHIKTEIKKYLIAKGVKNKIINIL